MQRPSLTPLFRAFTLRQQLAMLLLGGSLQLGWIVYQASASLEQVGKTNEIATQKATAMRLQQDADMHHDAVHSGVLRALHFGATATPEEQAQIKQDLQADQEALRQDLDQLEQLSMSSEIRTELVQQRSLAEQYVDASKQVATISFEDPIGGAEQYHAFLQQFHAMEGKMEHITGEVLAPALAKAEEEAATQREEIRKTLGWEALGVMLSLSVMTLLFGRQFFKNLEEVRGVAKKLGSGDFTVRNQQLGRDEVSDIGRAFNELGANLEGMVAKNEKESSRIRFATQLGDALDMAEQEVGVTEVVKRAMHMISDRPTSMMLADNSKAHMRLVASSPSGTAGCGVTSPWNCVAVRRATPMRFGSSEDLNACPRLRACGKAACSATCVPVSFMGKAIGVLHSTGPENEPVTEETLSKMVLLANQSGARIGAIRAMEKVQLQVSTDSLTGLYNRRTVESMVSNLKRENVPYAVAMVDLDHFKKLNDTFGHEAGDKALRHFAQVLKANQRSNDISARYGGEEFVLILPHTDAITAAQVVNRLRESLATSFSGDSPSFTLSCGTADTSLSPNFQTVLRAADSAAYQAKQGGRNQVVIWSPSTATKEVAANQPVEESDEESVADVRA